jgi:Tol biopolymer transport system component
MKMSDTKEMLQRARERFAPRDDVMQSLIHRRKRKDRNRRLSAGATAIVLALLSLAFLARAFRSADRPADEPSPAPRGIFSNVDGWITYANEEGTSGIWAVNPEVPGDPKDQILLSPGTGWPVAWSSDGSQLLILRPNTEGPSTQGFFGKNLFMLNADGTETRLTKGDTWITGGSFSPDGSKVVYATIFGEPSRIYVVNASGGAPQVLLTASRRWIPALGRTFRTELYLPTFSPDGSTIAYFDGMGDHSHSLRVMNADGSGSRVLLPELFRNGSHIYNLAWSPDGTRLLFDSDEGIYTLGADGSRLTLVIPGGRNAYWSPDGSRIAYSRAGGLVIADADGNHAHEFGYAGSGAWNPLA